MLILAHRPLLNLAKPVQKYLTVWPNDAISTLQDCCQYSDWNMFKEAANNNHHTDLQEYTDTVTAYIGLMMWQSPTPSPHGTGQHRLLKMLSDQEMKKTLKGQSVTWHQKGKTVVCTKMNNNFTESSNTQAVQTITDYRPVIMTHSSQIHSTTSTHGLRCRITHPYNNYPHPQHELSPADVRKTINPSWQHTWPCAERLCWTADRCLNRHFNTSLSQAVVPTCLESTTITPVPKKSPVCCLND